MGIAVTNEQRSLAAAQRQLDAARFKYGCRWIWSHTIIDWLRGIR
jgi:hypothetical protein